MDGADHIDIGLADCGSLLQCYLLCVCVCDSVHAGVCACMRACLHAGVCVCIA